MISNTAAMTLYNRYTDPSTRGDFWQRTVIPTVWWEDGLTTDKDGLVTNTVKVWIPYLGQDNFLDAVSWQALEEKGDYWTLQVGDILCPEELFEEIGVDEITVGTILRDHPAACKIRSISLFTSGSQAMWHWQIGGA